MAQNLIPLPSLIRASAKAAGDRNMRAMGRTFRAQEDHDVERAEFWRLVDQCFRERSDKRTSRKPLVRFLIADYLEQVGSLTAASDPLELRQAVAHALR